MDKEKLGINDFILACWDIDDTGWTFRLQSDMWWEVVAVSERLGKFREHSAYQTDVEETLRGLLKQIEEAKSKC